MFFLKKREKEKRAHRAAEMDSDDEQRGPLDVTFRDLTPTNEPALRRLNSIVFPIRYSVRPRPPRTPSSPRGGNKPIQTRIAHPRHSSRTRLAG